MLVNFCIGEMLGRRKTMWLAMGVVIVGAILQASAFNVPHLIIGRVITGAGTGLKTSTVPMYQAGKTKQLLPKSYPLRL